MICSKRSSIVRWTGTCFRELETPRFIPSGLEDEWHACRENFGRAAMKSDGEAWGLLGAEANHVAISIDDHST